MITNYDVEARREAKMHSDVRVLVLKPMEGKKTLSSTGAVDPRLFNGENVLRAIYDNSTGMWNLKYDDGMLPGGLKQRFTQFSELLSHTRQYFRTRNVEIEEILG